MVWALHCDHDLASGVAFHQVADRRGDVAERIGPVDDGPDLTRLDELTRLARTVRRWQPQILAWHATRLTNGPTEAVNLLVKKIKRVGHRFRNFDNYRLRLLLHCGVQWQTRPATSMRGRQPRDA